MQNVVKGEQHYTGYKVIHQSWACDIDHVLYHCELDGLVADTVTCSEQVTRKPQAKATGALLIAMD